MTEDKTKVKDLATELGVPTKNLLQALRELDIPAKSTSSNIAAEDIDRVKNHLKDSATSEQGDRREVQPGVIVRRRRQSTEDVAAEGEEAPRAERRAPRENHTPTAAASIRGLVNTIRTKAPAMSMHRLQARSSTLSSGVARMLISFVFPTTSIDGWAGI